MAGLHGRQLFDLVLEQLIVLLDVLGREVDELFGLIAYWELAPEDAPLFG